MVAPNDVSHKDVTLEKFLTGRFKRTGDPIAITVSGHSLGGALSPTLALWLLDTQSEWDPHGRATIDVYAYAGPTPGNARFATYIDDRFGERLHRIANPMDVVPHAWNVGDLAELKALYAPEIPRDALWDTAANVVIQATNGINYRQIGREPVVLAGRVKTDLIWHLAPPLVNLTTQVLYQHTVAYFELLGLPYPEQRSALGRHLAAQTGHVTKELLDRSGRSELVAGTLASALRLVAEAYSRIPLLPSPLPEMAALEHRA